MNVREPLTFEPPNYLPVVIATFTAPSGAVDKTSRDRELARVFLGVDKSLDYFLIVELAIVQLWSWEH